jgi:hypothetical protein
MTVRTDRPATKRPDKVQGRTRLAKTRPQVAEWEIANERLDEALRQTFPASDALSIVQNIRDR